MEPTFKYPKTVKDIWVQLSGVKVSKISTVLKWYRNGQKN